jgi:hypothetical protein
MTTSAGDDEDDQDEQPQAATKKASKRVKKSKTVVRASVEDVQVPDERLHTKVSVSTSTGRKQLGSLPVEPENVLSQRPSKPSKSDVVTEADLQRFGPYHNSHEQEKRILENRKSKLSAKQNGGDNINDALALATTGKSTSEGLEQDDQEDTVTRRLLPTQKAKLLEKMNNNQHDDGSNHKAANDDVNSNNDESTEQDLQQQQLDRRTSQSSAASKDNKDADGSKYMLSSTKSMLRKTEYLLNESRHLSGGKSSKSAKSKDDRSSSKTTASSQSLPKLSTTAPVKVTESKDKDKNYAADSVNKFPPIRIAQTADEDFSATGDGESADGDRYSVTIMSRAASPNASDQRSLEASESERINLLNQQLPDGWINQRVNDADKDDTQDDADVLDAGACSRAEWENQIARHILSVYATTKAGKDTIASRTAQQSNHVHEARAVLDYVDKKKKDTLNSVSDYVFSNNVGDDVLGTAVQNAKSKFHSTDHSTPNQNSSSQQNQQGQSQESALSNSMSRSRQLLSRENNDNVGDIDQQQQLVFAEYNATADEINGAKLEGSWAGNKWFT